MAAEATTATGSTVAEVALRYRISPCKVRQWIRRGELTAVNTAAALCGRPRWIVLPDSLAEFECRRAGGGPAPKPARKWRGRKGLTDFYPDAPSGAG